MLTVYIIYSIAILWAYFVTTMVMHLLFIIEHKPWPRWLAVTLWPYVVLKKWHNLKQRHPI